MLLSLLTCRETLARLDDYLDRELSPREMQMVARHLRICRHCSQIFGFETDLLSDIREKVARVETPPDFDELKAKILAALPDEPRAIENT